MSMRSASPKAMPAASMVTHSGTAGAPDCRIAATARHAAPPMVVASSRRAERGSARQLTALDPGARRSLQPRPAHGGPAHGGPAHGGPAHGGPAHRLGVELPA